MKSHLLASLLLLAAPLIARGDTCATTSCPAESPAKNPIATAASRAGKAPAPSASPAPSRFATAPLGTAAPTKPLPASRPPAKTARPGYLFM